MFLMILALSLFFSAMLMRSFVVEIVVRCLPDKSSLERCLSRERACKVAIMMMRLLVMMFTMFVKEIALVIYDA